MCISCVSFPSCDLHRTVLIGLYFWGAVIACHRGVIKVFSQKQIKLIKSEEMAFRTGGGESYTERAN